MNRRQLLMAGAVAGLSVRATGMAIGAEKEVKVGDNGLFVQDWFHESFLELAEDRASAAEEGKNLAVLFEQRGCPYCKEMHKVNFARQQIIDYVKNHFVTVQLDLWGSREVTDFDGTAIEEKALARRWNINFTPTMVFFTKEKLEKTSSRSDAEVMRMPGYFKPFHFMSMLEYVHEERYKTQQFQRYLQEKFKTLEKQGKHPDVW